MAKNCPPPADLLLEALNPEPGARGSALDRHLTGCERCRGEVQQLRQAVSDLRSAPPGRASGPCLDEIELAELLERVDPEADRQAITHLSACASCRDRLVGAMRLLEDPSVAGEVRRLHPAAGDSRGRRRVAPGALAGALAAAAVAGFLLWPSSAPDPASRSGGADEAYRERTITTTAAPRIVTSRELGGAADSLRWTSVPRADLYRVTVWNADGSTAWEGQTRDTVVPLPPELLAGERRSLLWDVKARTGWDRWVSSELAELTITEPVSIRP